MEEVISLERSIGRVEGKIDMIIASLGTKLVDHEVRIAATEKRVWYASGIAAVIALFFGKLSLFPH